MKISSFALPVLLVLVFVFPCLADVAGFTHHAPSTAGSVWMSPAGTAGDIALAEQWIQYWNGTGQWVWFVGPERSTHFDPDQFAGVTTPLRILRVRSWFYELPVQHPWGACSLFTYKIYADDGITMLLESDTISPVDRSGLVPTEWDLGPDSVEIASGTFWVSVSALCDSHPSSYADSVFQGRTFSGTPGSWIQFTSGELSMEAYVSWTAYTHDVSPVAILAPGYGAWVDSSNLVRVRVKNNGTVSEDFAVEFLIPPEYGDTVSILGLEPESTAIATFTMWFPQIYDTAYTLYAQTLLGTDENPLNDQVTKVTNTYEFGEIAYDDFEQDGWWAPTPPPNGPTDAFAQELSPYIAPPFVVTRFKIYVDSVQPFDNVRLCPALTSSSPDFDNPYQVISAPSASSPPEWIVVDFDTALTRMETTDPIWLCAQFEDTQIGPNIGSDEDGPYNLNSYWTDNLTSWNLFAEDLFMRVVHKQTTVGVGDDLNARGSAGVKLFENAPNPFRANTTVRFSTAYPCRASLSVFDTAGNLVKVLVSGRLDAGVHTAVWDAKDELGRDVGAGVYFTRLSVEGQRISAKMVLLR